EMNDRKERVKDAVGATKAAIEEGIVPGGEVTLLKASRALDTLKVDDEEKIGLDILRSACEQPFIWLLKNSGLDADKLLATVKSSKDDDFGVNVASGETGSMFKFGIIDPAKVTRSALQNAASCATMILTTECLVTEIPEEKKPVAPATPGMGEDY
ncbi:MAG: TCP-1/cpn60 chaperonin family protein, partial [Patescibacteria group bacterium]